MQAGFGQGILPENKIAGTVSCPGVMILTVPDRNIYGERCMVSGSLSGDDNRGGLAPRAVVGRLGPFGAHPPPQPRAAGQAHERRLAGADRLQVCA
jgi:hypothetical protein